MQTVTILGINGRIGQEVAKAFVGAHWRVIGMGRGNRAKLAGVEFFEGDANFPEQTQAAIADADVVVNALNLPYDKWDKGRAEDNLDKVLQALKGSGKTLMFPGNIYNYAEKQHQIRPDTPQNPPRDKGEIRQRMERQLQQAVQGGNIQVIIVRMADFFAPYAVETNFDLAILQRIKSNIVQYPFDLSTGHSWAYLPDVGRAFVKIAERRGDFPAFKSFHYSGHFATGHQTVAIIQDALPKRAKIKPVPFGLLSLIGIFVPILREVIKMNYLWKEPHQLVDPELDALLGANFKTPFDEAVAITVRSYLPHEGKMAVSQGLLQA